MLGVNDDGLVRAEITTEAAADGAGAVSEALLSRLQWAQEQKLGQYALAQGAKALEGLDAASLEELGRRQAGDGRSREARRQRWRGAKDALLAFFVCSLPQRMVRPISGILVAMWRLQLRWRRPVEPQKPAEQRALSDRRGVALVLEAKGVSFDLQACWKVRHQSWRAMSARAAPPPHPPPDVSVSFRLSSAEPLASWRRAARSTNDASDRRWHRRQAVASLLLLLPSGDGPCPFIKLHHLPLNEDETRGWRRASSRSSPTRSRRGFSIARGARRLARRGWSTSWSRWGSTGPSALDSAEQYVGRGARSCPRSR